MKISNGFQDKERTQFCDRPTDGKIDRQELRFLSSARRLKIF